MSKKWAQIKFEQSPKVSIWEIILSIIFVEFWFSQKLKKSTPLSKL